MTRRQLALAFSTSFIFAPSACKTEQPKVEPPPPSQPVAKVSPPPAAPAVPVPAVAAAPAEETVPEFAVDPHHHMKAHFVRALKLQDAVLAGRLDAAKAQGAWLAAHDSTDVPEGWRPYLKTFQSEAKVVADATSIDVAAAAVAHIAAACGDCHAANHAKPKIGGAPIVKDAAANVKAHMTAQLAALDKLWDGLVIPSDQAWRDGASLLSKVVVPQTALTKEGLDKAESATLLADTLHKLSKTAGKAAKADRPQAYADMLTTCVACHAAVRKPVGAASVAEGAVQN